MTTIRHRRPRNSGSLTELTGGRYRIRYSYIGQDGKRRARSETTRGSKRQAEKLLRERLTLIDSGGFAPQSGSVAEYLRRWLTDYAETNTTPRTVMGYRQKIQADIIPALGAQQLVELRPDHIQAMYSALLCRGLSGRSVYHVHRILRSALNRAVRWGLLIRNPTDQVSPPRPETKELQIWDVETINRFIKFTADHPFGSIWHVAILTGLRRSELGGLTWSSLNLDAATLDVTKTLQRITGSGLLEGHPKTPRSRRQVALGGEAVRILRAIHARQLEWRLAAGPAWINTDFVFVSRFGLPIDPDRYTKAFPKVVRDGGFPPLSMHGLRHCHASLMLRDGIHLKVVSERLGHSTITTTADTYSHLLPGLQEEAANRLDQQLASGS